MIALGNFFFKTRNYIFPFFYVVLFLPFPRITQEYNIIFWVGLVIAFMGQFVRALTIGLVYVVRGGKNRRIYAEGLVKDGLFSHCRNPMYVGNVLLIIGMSILSNSVIAIAIMIPLFIFIYQAIIIAEEAYLLNAYGKEFNAYCASVNRWIPKWKGLLSTIRKNEFKLDKVMLKEYGTTFIWLLGASLLVLYNMYWLSGKVLLGVIPVIILLGIAYLIARHKKKAHMRKLYRLRNQNT